MADLPSELLDSVDWDTVDPDSLRYRVLCWGTPSATEREGSVMSGWPDRRRAVLMARELVLNRRLHNTRTEVIDLETGQTLYVVDARDGTDGVPWPLWAPGPRARISPLAVA
jgi:hypothetical protein